MLKAKFIKLEFSGVVLTGRHLGVTGKYMVFKYMKLGELTEEVAVTREE
jgi:hypothetical protein